MPWCRGAYNSLENVTPLMVAAGESLKQGGHVYYLSTGSIAVLTTIDASGATESCKMECCAPYSRQ
jgi:N-acetylmuramic acid 6-phosphate (MurNAc-6-P) etherase